MKETENLKNFWDSMAERFSEYEIPGISDNCFLRNLYMNGILDTKGSALDIGCGGGKYTLAIAPYFDKVIGTDISDRMIAAAEEKRKAGEIENVAFTCVAWDETDIEKEGWKNKFDFVFAHMTPAVGSREAVEKLRAVSKNNCAVTKSVYRKSTVADRINSICSYDEQYGKDDILELFKMLWADGIMPKVFYEKETWNDISPTEKAVDRYIKRMSVKRELSAEEKDEIANYLESVSVNGMVTEATDAIVCTVYWSENKER